MSSSEQLYALLCAERTEHRRTKIKLAKAEHDAARFRRRINHLQSILKKCGMFICISWKPDRIHSYLDGVEEKTRRIIQNERSA